MLTSLECRFDSIQQIDEFCVATILDPRFKHHFFMETETQQLAREYLIDIIATTFQVLMSAPTKGHAMTIPPPQRTMIRHHLAKYGSVLLNYWRKLGQLVMLE